ncbi:hypothetical protein GCM10009801_44330 [Streptomyces albiaxialis]|uniref:AMP-dependent synthetase/ligase domain-containing protein n=1 Tax=Streptomyces albiaxialis TaxID=329523 RepID=A0ABP5HTD5_9ACTN
MSTTDTAVPDDAAVPGLLDWLDGPRSDRGVHTMDAEGAWQYTPYPELAARVRRVAAGLAGAGVVPGDVVSVVHRNGPGFMAAFFGALAAGATPSPAVPPALFQDRAAYTRHLGSILGTARPRVLLAEPDIAQEWGEELDSLGTPIVPLDDAFGATADEVPVHTWENGSTALLQFTSGSSSAPKGVEVSLAALEGQIALLARWLRFRDGNACGTWLPIHHDMGLVGMVLPSLVTQSELWVMQPDQFIGGAARWMRLLGSGNVQITSVPPFSLAHVLRRVRAEDLEGCDFSKMLVQVVGAEPIDSRVLDAYERLLTPFGWRPGTLSPAYGLAEATLAVTGEDLRVPPPGVRVDRARLRLGEKVVLDTGELPVEEPLELASSGRVLPGVTVEVRDEAGDPVPPGVLGEIAVGGVALADGYRGHPRWDGAFVTGDAGFFWNDRLHVLGRLGDALKVRGVQVFAEDLETVLGELPELRRVRHAVVLGSLEGQDTAAVLVVKQPGEWSEPVYRALRRQLRGVRVVVVAANRGAVRRTSSGKPQRRAMFDQLMNGTIDGVVLHDSGKEEQ